MSSQSPSNSSVSTDQTGQDKNPAAAFGPNEWLVDEIYQQYLQDPNSVDRAWWDFFADYKPGNTGAADKSPEPAATSTAAAGAAVSAAPAAPPATTTTAPAAPAKPVAAAPAQAHAPKAETQAPA
ncbi:hypothetical protein, partial [Streptomyces sp. NPDC058653]|uniref:2-oxoglutarate dehydrogenase E1 subunit family protein n=1 Tax=Streptomyces sp. NPDC058653 TaxID=3346576 RepID=UPI003668163C